MHHRRQHLDQRRRLERHRLWQHARPRHRRRGGARRWPHRQRLEQAAQGQHRLRREEPLHRRRRDARHRHRRFAPALSQSARAGDGVRRSEEPRRCAEAPETGARTARRRDHELRADQSQRLRHRDSTRRRARSAARRARLVRSHRGVIADAERARRSLRRRARGGARAGRHRGRLDRRLARAARGLLAVARVPVRRAEQGRRLRSSTTSRSRLASCRP